MGKGLGTKAETPHSTVPLRYRRPVIFVLGLVLDFIFLVLILMLISILVLIFIA